MSSTRFLFPEEWSRPNRTESESGGEMVLLLLLPVSCWRAELETERQYSCFDLFKFALFAENWVKDGSAI